HSRRSSPERSSARWPLVLSTAGPRFDSRRPVMDLLTLVSLAKEVRRPDPRLYSRPRDPAGDHSDHPTISSTYPCAPTLHACRARSFDATATLPGRQHRAPPASGRGGGRGKGAELRLSFPLRPQLGCCPSLHLMLQPMDGICSSGTALPSRTASIAPRRSAPVTGRPLPGRLESNWPR